MKRDIDTYCKHCGKEDGWEFNGVVLDSMPAYLCGRCKYCHTDSCKEEKIIE